MWKDINKENIGLLLIDFQEAFFPILKKSVVKEVRANISLTVQLFEKLNIPMVATEHYPKGLGLTDREILNEWREPEIIEKITFSCLGCPEFKSSLQKLDKSVIVLCGLETHVCVLQTALDLLEDNYKVITLNDAVLSTSKQRWKNGLQLMKDAGVQVMNTETLLFYLLKRADTNEFKFFSKILKKRNSDLRK